MQKDVKVLMLHHLSCDCMSGAILSNAVIKNNKRVYKDYSKTVPTSYVNI